ncbi:hypothetical protein CDL12_03115 [Handroanthus impetiginosus]|uniref:Uncharacterized protein n=1 Tax=Handroanthus impetiginosus TaxID=429701 RepID=A0A2G9I326_9LAMI|nr:hypothetical protein CDL12_03115 [Handroanthus impetiginosus]
MASKGEIAEAPLRQRGGGFYDSLAVRRPEEILLEQQKMMQKQLLQQPQQQQRLRQRQQQRKRQNKAPVKPASSSAVEAGQQNGVADSSMAAAFSVPPSFNGGLTSNITNLDRLMESVTPFIPARFLSEVNATRSTTPEVDSQPFFYLEDLWESFYEWSVCGVGVPLLLNGTDQVEQYYVPSLSGIQLYIDSSKPYSPLGGPTEEGNAESFRLKSSSSSSNSKGVRRSKSDLNMNRQLLNKLSLGSKCDESSGSSGAHITNSHGSPSFQFLESEQPYNRRPLTHKISMLASEFPQLNKCRSCDLLPSSWICVAWYPIYRIPGGPTLKDLEASFLAFHSLSTQSKSDNPSHFYAANTRKVDGFTDPTAKISLPVFGLASYKLKGSPISPRGPHECNQENSLFQAADNWLKRRQVNLPDYQFFRGHWR